MRLKPIARFMKDKVIALLKTLIKVTSIVLMSGAIALGGVTLYAVLSHQSVPSIPAPLLALGGFAVVAHLLEAIVAANLAPSRQKAVIPYAIYTFFVGTIGLQELWMIEAKED
ncbi:MAG: hypothetical protein WBA57_20680 [Elainellaceae cyanobacterium]